ncbi:MAG TPA: hypothetical protein DCY51_04435 [Bacteroidetes bacterium]|nr:hypothetical protein [Bacteroidota bacterium]
MNDIIYVGSTCLKLDKLEGNHRNAEGKGYTMTKFRKALSPEMKFEWLVYPSMRTEEEILVLEGRLIDKYLPRFNEAYDTISMKKKLDTKLMPRGVYGVTYV